MTKYKFRAECTPDLGRFIMNSSILIQSMECNIKNPYFPDIEVSITTESPIEDILQDIKRIGGDLHVIYETLQTEPLYDADKGKRIRTYYI